MIAAGPGGWAWRVLVVDGDQEELGGALRSLLQVGGDFRLASDRHLALEIAASFLPHVVLLDVGLPRLEGFHLARHFRQLQLPGPTWLVAASRFGDGAFRTLAKEAGFDDFVMKPYTTARFQQVFAEAVRCQPELARLRIGAGHTPG